MSLLDNILAPATLLFASLTYIVAPLIRNIIAYKFDLQRIKTERKHKIFEEYSKRYTSILSSAFSKINSFNDEFDSTSSIQRQMALNYFMLISEEYYLSVAKLIDDEIWLIWRGGVEYHMEKRYFIGAWFFAKNQMDFEGDFSYFIEDFIPKDDNDAIITSRAS